MCCNINHFSWYYYISAKLCISFPFGIGRCFYVCIHQLPSCFTFESLTLISGNGGEMPEESFRKKEIYKFPKCEWKFWGQIQMEQKFQIPNLSIFIGKLLKMLFYSPLEISINRNQNFSSNGKCVQYSKLRITINCSKTH